MDTRGSGRRLSGTVVLVVDDDEASGRRLREALESWGALVIVTSGVDARREALRADVIVCDLGVAAAAGRDLLAELQRRHSRPNRPVPIVALVPEGMETPATARAAGVERYLLKPVDPVALREAVQRLARE